MYQPTTKMNLHIHTCTPLHTPHITLQFIGTLGYLCLRVEDDTGKHMNPHMHMCIYIGSCKHHHAEYTCTPVAVFPTTVLLQSHLLLLTSLNQQLIGLSLVKIQGACSYVIQQVNTCCSIYVYIHMYMYACMNATLHT